MHLCSLARHTSTRPRPLVPGVMRREVFDIVHGLSHPGTRATVRIMNSKFVWHGIAKDVRTWARACVACQTAKVHRHNKAPLQKVEKGLGEVRSRAYRCGGPVAGVEGTHSSVNGGGQVHKMA